MLNLQPQYAAFLGLQIQCCIFSFLFHWLPLLQHTETNNTASAVKLIHFVLWTNRAILL